jgi:hypothetical protein
MARDLCNALTPASDLHVQILVPLFVDTFPLAYFYQLVPRRERKTYASTQIIDWQQEDPLFDAINVAVKENIPIGIYLSRKKREKLFGEIRQNRKLSKFFETRFIPISKLLIPNFYVKSKYLDALPHTDISIDSWLRQHSEHDTIYIFSDIEGLSNVGESFLDEKIKSISTGSARPTLSSARRNMSMRSPYRDQNAHHVYWYSALGRVALNKTGQIPHKCNLPKSLMEKDEHILDLALFFPRKMPLDVQNDIICSFSRFHQILFEKNRDELCNDLQDVWVQFMSLVVTKWPIFNLFESVEEYVNCFCEHHDRLDADQ